MYQVEKDKWVVRVFATTTLLAICAAVSAIQASSFLTTIQDQTTVEANHKTSFQAKTIQEHSFRLQMELFELNKLIGNTNPAVQKFIENKVKEYDDAVAHYEKEKAQLKEQEQGVAREAENLKKHGKNFTRAVLWLQIAILMASLGMMIQKRIFWVSSLGLGSYGVLCMMNGFFLWF